MSTTIYVVIAQESEAEFGSPRVVGAFTDESSANELVAACSEYQRLYPHPHILNIGSRDTLVQAIKRWRSKHPGGKDAAGWEEYYVKPVQLRVTR